MNLIRPLAQVTTSARYGGKAHNLKRVMDMGLPVPETFVLETAALSAALSALGIENDVDDYLAGDVSEPACEALCRQIVESELAPALSDDIVSLVSDFDGSWAVRSSAVLEDSKQASFAGVFESRIGARHADEVSSAIKQVWCSLYSPRAVRYSRAMGIAPGRDNMAVMLQPVVPADYAGVMYTADRASGDPEFIEIVAVKGLSVSLMSGDGEGTTHRVNWQSEAVVDVDVEGDRDASLAPDVLAPLVTAAKRLDRFFGCRMDIEWAVADGKICIIQARPLTALPEFFPAAPPDDRAWRHPLLVLPLREPAAGNLITPLYDDMDEQELWFRHHRPGMTLTGPVIEYVDLLGHRYGHESRHPTFIDHCNEHGWDTLEPWVRENEPVYFSRWRNHTTDIEAIIGDAQQALNEITDAQAMFRAWHDARDRTFDLVSFGWSAPQAMGWMFEALLARLMREEGIDYDGARLLVSSEGSCTYRFSRDLQALAVLAEENGIEDRILNVPLDEILPGLRRERPDCKLLAAFEALCWRYGKYAFGWEGRPPFWRPDEAALYPLLQSLRGALDGSAADVIDRQRAAFAKSEVYRLELRQKVGDRETFDWIVERGRIWTQALNDRHEVRAALQYEKAMSWRLGELLVESGVMEFPEQVLALRVQDLDRLFDLPSDDRSKLVVESWQRYEHHARLTAPVELGRRADVDPVPPVSASEPTSEFHGRGMSGTRITGRVRIVRDLQDASFLESLEPEDLLVLLAEHAFFYADWHAILTMVGGVVSRGRPSHHLSQVARECDVAVLGYVEGNLESIADRSRAELDPASGTLRILG